MHKEGLDYMGEHPCVFTEIGIPFDMNDGHAYKTGDYSSQCMALDANYFAIERCGGSGSTLWVYAAKVRASYEIIPIVQVHSSYTSTST